MFIVTINIGETPTPIHDQPLNRVQADALIESNPNAAIWTLQEWFEKWVAPYIDSDNEEIRMWL